MKLVILMFATFILSIVLLLGGVPECAPCAHPEKGKCLKGNCKNGLGTFQYDNGNRYEGNFKNCIKDGIGALYYADGQVYDGYFVNDKRHGQGAHRYANGDKYIGDFENDLRHGYGKLIPDRGAIKEGHFVKDVFQNPENKKNSVGCIIGDCTNGTGNLRYSNGDRYEGGFKDGLKHGRGTYNYANGDVYEGEYANDMRHGTGTYSYYNGDIYMGQFVEGKREGQGELLLANGSVEKGLFRNNKFMGETIPKKEKTKNLNCKQGDCQNGFGVMVFPNNEKYEGDWKNGLMEGQGTFSYADGMIYQGAFKNNIREGYGTMSWPNGNMYVGQWAMGAQEGRGQLIDNQGQVQDGFFKNGKYIGTKPPAPAPKVVQPVETEKKQPSSTVTKPVPPTPKVVKPSEQERESPSHNGVIVTEPAEPPTPAKPSSAKASKPTTSKPNAKLELFWFGKAGPERTSFCCHVVEVCIPRGAKPSTLKVFVNNKMVANLPGSSLVQEDKANCGQVLRHPIQLEHGENKIVVQAENDKETVLTDPKLVTKTED